MRRHPPGQATLRHAGVRSDRPRSGTFGRIVVANGTAGTIASYDAEARPVGAAIAVGKYPHGNTVEFSKRLYVPVDRGVAVVDIATRKVIRTIPLPGTPASIWIAPSTGRLFAPLYAQNKVAVVDTATPDKPPKLVATGPRPVAVSGSGSSIYVANADKTIARLDPRTGKLLRSARQPALTASPAPVAVLAPVVNGNGKKVTVTIPLRGGTLDPTGLVVRNGSISDGAASLELWQGAIRSRAGGPRTRQRPDRRRRAGDGPAHGEAVEPTRHVQEHERRPRSGRQVDRRDARQADAPNRAADSDHTTHEHAPTGDADPGPAAGDADPGPAAGDANTGPAPDADDHGRLSGAVMPAASGVLRPGRVRRRVRARLGGGVGIGADGLCRGGIGRLSGRGAWHRRKELHGAAWYGPRSSVRRTESVEDTAPRGRGGLGRRTGCGQAHWG